jgi:uncharacterized repeat protein (TIGR01451 family)
VTVGQEVTFTVQITNTGNSALIRVPLTQSYDAAHLTFISADPMPSRVDSGEIVWSNLAESIALGAGAGRTVTIRYLAQASSDPLPDQRTGQSAQIIGAQDGTGQFAASAQASAGVRITAPSLMVRKSPADGQTVAVFSAPITFTIHLSNTGDTRLDQIKLADVFASDEFAFRSAQVTPTHIEAGELVWDDITTSLGDIAPGQIISFSVSFTTTTTASQVRNEIRVDPIVDENGDPVLLISGQTQVNVNVATVDLTIESDPPAGSSVRPGQCILYNLTATNTGAVDLTNTVLTVNPPEGTTLVDACPQERHARLADPQVHEPPVVWPLGTLAQGQVATRQLRVVVDANIQVTAIVLRAEVTSEQIGDFAFTSQVTNVFDPTAVTLLHFVARSHLGGVQVEWITGVEINSWGFHVWRTPTEQWFNEVQVTQAIIPARGSNGGAAYTVHDPQGRAGDYYWLQESETDGRRNLYGPVRVNGVTTSHPPQKLYLPMIGR